MKIGYFGEASSHTYACAEENAPPGAELKGYPTIGAAAEALAAGETDGAFLPIENSVGGSVGETLDALKKHELYITAQYFRHISHSLISVEGADKKGIKRIFSHPNALVQCERYIARNFPNAKVEAVTSTSEALSLAVRPDRAAIARAPLPGQIVLEDDVQDDKTNTTRFVYLGRKPEYTGGSASVLFDIRNEPGMLLKVLGVLAEYNLNMNKLESRSSRDGGFRYWFYVEFECPLDRAKLQEVMDKLTRFAGFLRFAGMY